MDGGRDRPQGKPYAFGNAKVTRDAFRGVFPPAMMLGWGVEVKEC